MGIRLAWLTLLGASLIACGSDDDKNDAPDSRITTIAALTADTAAGKTLYEAQCAACHGADGKSGSAAINTVLEAANDKRDAIEQVIEGGGGMTAFASLSDQEIANVIGYLASLK